MPPRRFRQSLSQGGIDNCLGVTNPPEIVHSPLVARGTVLPETLLHCSKNCDGNTSIDRRPRASASLHQTRRASLKKSQHQGTTYHNGIMRLRRNGPDAAGVGGCAENADTRLRKQASPASIRPGDRAVATWEWPATSPQMPPHPTEVFLLLLHGSEPEALLDRSDSCLEGLAHR